MQTVVHGKLHSALEDDISLLFPFEQQQQPDVPYFSFGSTMSPKSWHFEKSDNIRSSQLQHLVHTQPIHLINPQALFNDEFLNLENVDSQPHSKEAKTAKGNKKVTAPIKQKKNSTTTRSSSLSSLFSNNDTVSTYRSSYDTNSNDFEKNNKNDNDIDMIDAIKYETNTNLQKDVKIFQESFEFNEFAYAQDFYPHTTNYTYSKPTNTNDSINAENMDLCYQRHCQYLPHTENLHSFNNRHYSNNKNINNNNYPHNNNNNNNNASADIYESDPFVNEPQGPSYYYPLEIAFDIEKSPPAPPQKFNLEELEFLKKLNAKLSRYAAAYSISASNDQEYYDKVRFQEISYKFSKTYS